MQHHEQQQQAVEQRVMGLHLQGTVLFSVLQRLGERAAQGRCLAHVQRLSDRKADGARLFVGVHFKDLVSVLGKEDV